ncbi:disintegrin and metalloproteinase domain-containing protein [Elysia marginata]|uniref:Disintegrin and metalloproteinase domain-containing protein n=1 Tax=Elysia marginata TaxID=1093978 RepID=A0AAV4HLJ6_9GAST|nr:disintegrin and metalloproteinase domain-containing protein [Elysia marginata]
MATTTAFMSVAILKDGWVGNGDVAIVVDNEDWGSHLDNITAEFAAFGVHFTLDLSLNRQLLSGAYIQKVFHGTNQHSSTETNDIFHSRIPHSDADHCYYHGQVRHHPGSSAAVSSCDGLRGYIIDRHESYHIEPVQGNILRIYRSSDQRPLPFKCGTEGHDPKQLNHHNVLHRQRRSTNKVRAAYDSNADTRYVELYLVSDYRTYERHGKNITIVIQRSKDIANIVSSLYRQLNIYVILVGVEVWAGGDLIRVSASADNTMENFLRYRMRRINPVHHNDNAQLITGVFFDHGVVGKAIKGPICTHQFSGGVNMDYGGTVSVVATTVAHEMGHNFGMEHDNDTQCDCLSDKCIMSATSGKISPKSWSSCSHNALAEAFHLGMDYCLRNVPDTVYKGPECGNGLMEEGEECDCGLPEDCTSQCCNPHTCQLYPNAVCATGKCCDLKTCQPATTQCRAAAGECDLPEFCNGTLEFCPDDVFDQDGRECMSGQSYCYKGKCATHTNQCKLLWGESGRVSDPICFQQLNMKGNEYGSCGYNWTSDKYLRCNKEDVMCGLLHCVHLNEKLMFWRDNLAIAKRASFLTRGNNQYVCRSAMLDVGLDMADPGFAGDGVKCEHNKICLKHKCVALGKLKIKQCPQNCNGHGKCNSEGNCHCDNGYAPPQCDKPGYGGSIDSGPASNENGPIVTHRPAVTGSSQGLDLDQETATKDWNVSVSTNSSGPSGSGILGDDDDKLVALLVIFLLVLPLLVLIVVIACCRARLKPYWSRFIRTFTNWAKCKNRKPKPIPPAKDFDVRGKPGGAKNPRPPIYRDKQVSNPLLIHQEGEKNSKKSNVSKSKSKDFSSKVSKKDNAPPVRPPPPPNCPPSLARSGSKTGSKKVCLSTPIQETQGPPSATSKLPNSSNAVNSALLSTASEDERAGPVKIVKRESFRGSQISSPVLVCTTNRDSLVLADGNVDIIGPEAFSSKPSSVKRSQSERGELGSSRPSVIKSASVRTGLGEETSALASTGGFQPRPVPPLPLEEDEDDTQPIYSNEGLGMGDLWSEIKGSLFKEEEQPLYNNLPIQETAPPCPPRPEKYRPSTGRSSALDQSKVEAQPMLSAELSEPSEPSQKSNVSESVAVVTSKVLPSISRGKAPTRQPSLKSKPASNNGASKQTDSSKNDVAHELRQKMLSRSNFSAPGGDASQKNSALSGPKKTANNKNGPSPSTSATATSSVKPNTPKASGTLTKNTSNPARSSISPDSVKAASKNPPTRPDGKKPGGSSNSTDESPPSVSSLKAMFSQPSGGSEVTSKAQKAAPNISGTSSLGNGAPVSNASRPLNSSKVSNERTASGPKAPVQKGQPQKPTSVLKTETDKNQTKSKVAELKAALDKSQVESTTGASKLPGKPVPQVRPGGKPVASERSGSVKSASSVLGATGQSSGQPSRPVLPRKPGETKPSDSSDKSVPKAATRTPGVVSSSQPKRVQSFRI